MAREWPGSTRVYDYLRDLNRASLERNWRLDGEGLDRLAGFRRGIIAINHGHIVDGSVIIPLVQERVLFLCDARAVDAPILGPVLRAIGVVRTDVTRPDPAAARAAARAASAGHLLGIFPEGRVSTQGLRPARPGIAHLAARLRLPVLPVAMWGLDAFNAPIDVYVRRVRPTISVRVGRALTICPPRYDRAALRSAADAIMVHVAEQLPVELRGVYSEHSARYGRGRSAIEAGWVIPYDTGMSAA